MTLDTSRCRGGGSEGKGELAATWFEAELMTTDLGFPIPCSATARKGVDKGKVFNAKIYTGLE